MVEKRSLGQKLDWAVYITFFVVVLCLPLLTDDVFWLNRISKFLVFGLLGLAIALSWGYAGVLNLGQGLFFGLGAYMFAMSLKLKVPQVCNKALINLFQILWFGMLNLDHQRSCAVLYQVHGFGFHFNLKLLE